MKIGVEVIAYNDDDFLKAALSPLACLDQIAILINKKPWFGEAWAPDRTLEISREFARKDKKYWVIEGDWPSEHEQRNHGLRVLYDCDVVLIVDADEIWESEKLVNFVEIARRTYHKSAAWTVPCYVYWKNPNWILLPNDGHRMLSAVKPDRVAFVQGRLISGGPIESLGNDFKVHHFSYVRRTDERIKRKIASFNHAPEIVGDWYEKVWLKWEPGMQDLHPVNPHMFKRAEQFECPKEIRELIALK